MLLLLYVCVGGVFWLFFPAVGICAIEPETHGDQSAIHDPLDSSRTGNEPSGSAPEEEGKTSGRWFDNAHQQVCDKVQDTALWFDGFFGDERNQEEQADASLRMRLGWEPDMRDIGTFPIRFRLKVRLPLLKERFDLIFSEPTSEEDERMPLEAERPEGFGAGRDREDFQAALRWMVRKTDDLQIDTRVGFKSGVQPFFRARYQNDYVPAERIRLRLSQTAYWEGDNGFGVRSLFEAEYQTSGFSFFRSSSGVDISERSDGLDWSQRLERLHQITPRMAIVPGGGVSGKTDPETSTSKYTFSIRYRHNVLRPWFYYEVEPFVDWPREENFSAIYGIAFRVEVFFEKGINRTGISTCSPDSR